MSNMPAGCSVADLSRAFRDVRYAGDNCGLCGNLLEFGLLAYGICSHCEKPFCPECKAIGVKRRCEVCEALICLNCEVVCEFCQNGICPACSRAHRSIGDAVEHQCGDCLSASLEVVTAQLPDLRAIVNGIADGKEQWTDELADRLERIARQVRDRSAA